MGGSRVFLSTLLFLLVIALILVSQPRLLFTPDGRIRPFGASSPEATPFAFGTLVVVTAILSFFLLSLIDVVFA